MALADQPRMIGLALAESWRRLRRRLLGSGRGHLRISGPAPERLVLAPQDLHTADPTIAQEIYAGVFHFAGKSVNASGANPFTLDAVSPEWRRELHSFGWLRHLGAAGDAVSPSNAQALVRDWIAAYPKPRDNPAWDVETTGRRLIAWLSHSVMLVEGADINAYRRFMKSIGYHIRYLRSAAVDAPDGLPRLVALTALAYGDVCVSGSRFAMRQAQKNLAAELARQILPDGGHISRNPAILAEALALLLPLRQSFARLGQAPSVELVSAIDRMMPALRFFRLGDGSLARFNGVSAPPLDLLATVLRYDESLGPPPPALPMSGYHRLVAGGAIVLVDAGKPPPGELSAGAHAGVLSFEMSAGESPLVVNCGIPALPDEQAVRAARSTAAHSTATLNDTSSCRFNVEGVIGRLLESRIVSGPSSVTAELREEAGAATLATSHDGYARLFGFVHERELTLAADGSSLMGADRFRDTGAKREPGKDAVAIRFHLHPSVKATPAGDGHTVLLDAAGGEKWRFVCLDALPSIEESAFFAVPGPARRTSQIVLEAAALERPEIRWVLARR